MSCYGPGLRIVWRDYIRLGTGRICQEVLKTAVSLRQYTMLLYLTLLLWTQDANAYWRMPCVSPITVDRIDPIFNPGTASGHLHSAMGGSNFGMTTSYEDLRASKCTTCMVAQDLSAYWVPTLYYHAANGSVISVNQIGGATVYYFQRGNDPMVAFPPGFRMIAGNPFLRSFDASSLAQQAISHKCIDYNVDHPQTPHFPDIDCPDGLRTQVTFPSCWNGKDLDSADHHSHMAYPDEVDNGNCPSSHPVRFITLFMEVLWDITKYKDDWPEGQWPFVLSTGDPTGYGHHADFITGWDPAFLQVAIDNCTNDSGTVQDCFQFDLIDQSVTTECRNVPTVQEPRFGQLNKLPGCNPIQSGPAMATIEPTCVAATFIPPPPPSPTTTFSNLPSPTMTIPGFTMIYENIDATVVANGWLGYAFIDTYEPYLCGDQCLQTTDCVYFSMYQQKQSDGRTPTVCQFYNAVWGPETAQNNGWGGNPIVNGQAWAFTAWVPGAQPTPSSSKTTQPIDTTTTSQALSRSTSPPIHSSSVNSPPTQPATLSSRSSFWRLPSASATVLPSYRSWSSLGCYGDSSNRVLSNHVSVQGSLTVQSCLDTCLSKEFNYAGVEYSGECWCDVTIRNNPSSSSKCDAYCVGDSSESCGGFWAINLYKSSATITPPGVLELYSSWSSLGCYNEGIGGTALSYVVAHGSITADACLDVCASRGFQYAGLEAGDMCYCGNTINHGSQKAATGCSQVCSGNFKQYCGGRATLQLYINSAYSNTNFAALNRPYLAQETNVTAPTAASIPTLPVSSTASLLTSLRTSLMSSSPTKSVFDAKSTAIAQLPLTNSTISSTRTPGRPLRRALMAVKI